MPLCRQIFSDIDCEMLLMDAPRNELVRDISIFILYLDCSLHLLTLIVIRIVPFIIVKIVSFNQAICSIFLAKSGKLETVDTT